MYWFGRFLERAKPSLDNIIFNNFLLFHLRSAKPDYVLAEFGTTAAWLIHACKAANVPLYVIFHGYDASVYSLLEENKYSYQQIFKYASGIIAVSKVMQRKLISLGASPSKIKWSPCGVDPEIFKGGEPEKASPTFFCVGRFVEKKAPYLTILAFHKAQQSYPEAKLRLIGDGPLLGPCKRLVQALNLENSVTFLGPLGPNEVASEMRSARAFVQHSVVAENGDSEGTPVAVIEAQMTSIPVISTKHAGIPDVVIDGQTGYLVDEGDIDGMAASMIKLLTNPSHAKELGDAGRERSKSLFTLDHHINAIAEIIHQKK